MARGAVDLQTTAYFDQKVLVKRPYITPASAFVTSPATPGPPDCTPTVAAWG